MRLFLAVVPPESALQELDAAVSPLRDLPGAAGLRWTGTQGWHLTLAFLGQVDPADVAALEPRLERVAHRHPAHVLRVTGGGRFGDRVLWAGVKGDTHALRRLAESASAAARHSGIAVDERPFRGHLTLARGGSARVDLKPFAAALAEFEGAEWTAGSLRLMRSYLGAGPAHYETVGEWELTGKA
ncbi:RNA 2',3'-cyclic phosphodiesterase [Streptacidiphilus pinicola]|uniref:RNA 2',3'-cyclic phosphodiesterase n=1 Tax=Streptacidiphilus pinicola TaxID=2219663 RepID=A0A2X0J2J8_9ACTN|nr:RNA 2',3'-cyclic phosphodiesterase [Streptacidiphilus pinicola]RAG84426.1 RNA 2',3'-cyclic phosphodiesterase [Streptacidiphilus pinicola]